jgi:transposase-like protein
MKHHSDETRAAIMAALLAGQGVVETAKEFKVPKQTVSDMKAKLDERLGQSGLKKDIATQVLELLEIKLNALKAIAQSISRSEYIQKQPASEVAVLYGVLADKAFRILSALEPDEKTDAEKTPDIK